MILWQNLGYTKLNKGLRRVLVVIIVALILIAAMYVNVLQIFADEYVEKN